MTKANSIQDIYPLSYMQEGMLFHSLLQKDSQAYVEQASFSLTEADTAVLLQNVNHAYGTDTQDILLTAASLAICEWTGGSKLRIAMEGHGREHILPELDISRTVGWFTSMYPALIS